MLQDLFSLLGKDFFEILDSWAQDLKKCSPSLA